MNFIWRKQIVCLIIFVTFMFVVKTSFCMNEEVKKEIKFFWGKKTPWEKSVESTIELDINFLIENKFPCGHLSIIRYYYEFYSKIYIIFGRYIQKKAFLKNGKTGESRLLKSFEDHDDSVLIEDYDGKKELIDKNDGHVICEEY